MNKTIELLLDELNCSQYEVEIGGKKHMIIPSNLFDKNCDLINKEVGNIDTEEDRGVTLDERT